MNGKDGDRYWTVRRAGCEDYSCLADVMYDAVRNGPSAYSESQRQAWVPVVRSGPMWEERLSGQWIAMAIKGAMPEQVAGFISLAEAGYIDFAYVRPQFQGQGVFSMLLQALEREARARSIKRLWVHASLNAEASFRARGFCVNFRESVAVGTESLDRFEMEKQLNG